MRKTIFVLASAVIVFIATLVFTNRYVSEKALDAASAHNTHLLNSFSQQFDKYLYNTQLAAQSFLAAEFNTRFDSVPEFYVTDSSRREFRKWIQRDMKDFLNLNPQLTTVFFLIDDSVSEADRRYGCQKGFAVYNTQGDDATHMLKDYDFMHSKSYNKVKKLRTPFWTTPSANSKFQGIITLFIPVFCEDGSFFGAFGLDIDISDVKEAMVRHLPYGKENSKMMLYDCKKGGIVSTADSFFHQHGKDDAYMYYQRYIPNADWYVMTACNKDSIYQSANHVRWVIFITSGIGMLLMLLCCLFVFHRIRKDMQKRARAEEELKLAAQVQLSLLKPVIFESKYSDITINAYMKPANEAGGDLYDYVERYNAKEMCREIFFCIGDVSGKGMPAALFMTQVVSLFRNVVRHVSEPQKIAKHINDVLASDNPNMMFCTFLIGKITSPQGDGEETTLTLCNAGHNPPIMATHGTAEYLKVTPNVALGLMEGYPYKQETVTFPLGSRLICYTDGVTEAKDRRRQQYGEKRLLDNVSDTIVHRTSSNVNDTIVRSVSDFVGNAKQSDDITLITVSSPCTSQIVNCKS